MLRKRVKEQDKEIRRLKEENEFLEEASAFFAASRRKSVQIPAHLTTHSAKNWSAFPDVTEHLSASADQ